MKRTSADVARDGERDCLAGRKRRDETKRRVGLAWLQCYDQAMAIGLRGVVSNAGERAEINFLSLDRLERIGMKSAGSGHRGDCRQQADRQDIITSQSDSRSGRL